MLVFHQDKPGVISAVSGCLSNHGINIAFMKVFRTQKKQDACMVIETDEPIPSWLSGSLMILSPDITEVCAL